MDASFKRKQFAFKFYPLLLVAQTGEVSSYIAELFLLDV